MTREEAIAWLKLERKARDEISKGEGILPALDIAIESLQKYETFCGIPMEETYRVMRGYSLGEYAEVVRCKNCKWEFICRQTVKQANVDNIEYRPLEWCSYGKRR